MLPCRHSLLRVLVAALYVSICHCSSETAPDVPEKAAVNPPESPEPPPDRHSSQQGGSRQENLVVAFVPDYPSKITQPWMLANTSHLIMFYASWCPYSEAAMPQFKAALQHVIDHNITGVHLGKIEVTKNKDVIKNFKVRSTPTFVMYHRQTRYVYDGQVTTDNLISFMHRVLEINLTEVSTARELSTVQRDHPVVFLLVHDDQQDPDWHRAYSRVAQEKGVAAKFIYTTKIDLVQDFNVTKYPTLLVLKDGNGYIFSDSKSTYNIGKWVSREQYAAFPLVDEDGFRPFTKFVLGRKLAILVVHKDPSKQRITEKRLIDTVRRVAESRKHFPHFQFVQLTSVELAERMTQSEIPSLPYLFVYEHSTAYYYPFQPSEDGGVTESSITEFCHAVRNMEIEPLGGRESFMSSLQAFWVKVYTMYQVMVNQRPWLSLGAGFSLCSVFIFYTAMCLRQRSSSSATGRRRRGKKPRTAALRSKRQTDSQSETSLQQNGSLIRRRKWKEEREREEGEEEEGESEGSVSGQDSHNEEKQHKHKS